MVNLKGVKVGDKVRVTDKQCGHDFRIGEVVTVVGISDYDINAKGDNGWTWYLHPAEYTPHREVPAGKVKVEFVVDRKDLERAYEILGMEHGGYGTYKAIQKALGKDW